MDPFTTLGLAGNVLQFIDFTSKIFGKVDEIRHVGSPTSIIELANITRDFDVLARKLEIPNHSGHLSSLSQDDQAILDMSRECAKIAKNLSTSIHKISARPNQSTLRTLRQALRIVWTEKDILALTQRFSGYRDQLQFRMAVMTKQSVDIMNLAGDKRDSELKAAKTTILDSIADHSAITTITKLYDTVLELRGIMEGSEKKAAHRHHDLITSLQQDPESAPELPSLEADSSALTYLEKIKISLIELLQFGEMHHREEDVAVAHRGTFEWITSTNSQANCQWKNFRKWLSDGEGCYWISGKAGSGKSTLMKHIIESTATRSALKPWTGTYRLVIASFYLWRSGSKLQKNAIGLFSKLLSEVLVQCPELIETLFSEWIQSALRKIQAALFQKATQKDTRTFEVYQHLCKPTDVAIRKAFENLVNHTFSSIRLCFFIDGLDEIEGDVDDLLQLLLSIKTPCIKLVISSRPIQECTEAFQEAPSLKLQDLTSGDMYIYITGTLDKHSNSKHLEASTIEKLKREIVEKASGVFLWTVLVVKSLLTGLRNCDTATELRRRLDDYPPELDSLYRLMLQSINPFYRDQASQLLQISMRAATQNDTLHAVELFWANAADVAAVIGDPIETFSSERFDLQTTLMEARLRSRCCGLLEVNGRQEIAFLHRTVLDFLQEAETWADMLTLSIDTQFDANVSLVSATLAMLKFPTAKEKKRLLVAKCLRYMVMAEQSTNNAQTDYFRSLCGTMDHYWRSERCWTYMISPTRPILDPLSLAVARGLCLFVKQFLETHPGRVLGESGRDLLITALKEHTTSAVFGTPQDQEAILTVLLDAGADPYYGGRINYSAVKFDREWVNRRFHRLFAEHRENLEPLVSLHISQNSTVGVGDPKPVSWQDLATKRSHVQSSRIQLRNSRTLLRSQLRPLEESISRLLPIFPVAASGELAPLHDFRQFQTLLASRERLRLDEEALEQDEEQLACDEDFLTKLESKFYTEHQNLLLPNSPLGSVDLNEDNHANQNPSENSVGEYCKSHKRQRYDLSSGSSLGRDSYEGKPLELKLHLNQSEAKCTCADPVNTECSTHLGQENAILPSNPSLKDPQDYYDLEAEYMTALPHLIHSRQHEQEVDAIQNRRLEDEDPRTWEVAELLLGQNEDGGPTYQLSTTDPNEQTISKIDFINQWILQQLRCSPVEAMRFARVLTGSFEYEYAKALDGSALIDLALTYWFMDGIVDLRSHDLGLFTTATESTTGCIRPKTTVGAAKTQIMGMYASAHTIPHDVRTQRVSSGSF